MPQPTTTSSTLSELSRKKAGVGPVRAAQPGSPFTAPYSGTYPTANDAGVATDAALLANVIVKPTGGYAEFDICGRSAGGDGAFELLDGWEKIRATADKPTKYRVFCETELELVVVLSAATSATSVDVFIEPCNG